MEPSRRHGAAGWVLAAMAVATATGAVVGTVVGALVYVLSDPQDGWRDLASVASGLVVGFGAAVVTWVAGVVVVVRRFRPPGRRLGVGLAAVAASLLLPALVLGVLGVFPA